MCTETGEYEFLQSWEYLDLGVLCRPFQREDPSVKFTAGCTPRFLCLQNWSMGTWSDESDKTALFIHFRLAFTFLWFILGKQRKSYITKQERVWKSTACWIFKL